MKKAARRLLRWMIVLVILFLFRGWIYRQIVAYQPVGDRREYLPESVLLKAMLEKKRAEIFSNSTAGFASVHQIIETAQEITAEKLAFEWASCPADPNETIRTGKANCIGYAALCAMICNDFFEKAGLNNQWKAHPEIGKLYAFGVDVHPYFHSAFFKDHDFVIVENRATGEVIAVDPVVWDMAGIKRVSLAAH